MVISHPDQVTFSQDLQAYVALLGLDTYDGKLLGYVLWEIAELTNIPLETLIPLFRTVPQDLKKEQEDSFSPPQDSEDLTTYYHHLRLCIVRFGFEEEGREHRLLHEHLLELSPLTGLSKLTLVSLLATQD